MLLIEDYLWYLTLIIITIVLSYLSIKKNYLTFKGALLANIFGIIILFTGGPVLFVALLIVFLITNLATKYQLERKISMQLILPKKFIRNWQNVLANGIALVFFSILEIIYQLEIFIFAYLGSLTTLLSDTISSEIGVLSKKEPRLITNFKKVHTGRPGAISLLGLISGITSVLIFSLITYFLFFNKNILLFNFVIILLVSSTLGNLIDSVFGATLQGIYYCKKCNKYSEEKIHACKVKCKLISGNKLINNHVVNLISTFLGGTMAILLFMYF